MLLGHLLIGGIEKKIINLNTLVLQIDVSAIAKRNSNWKILESIYRYYNFYITFTI